MEYSYGMKINDYRSMWKMTKLDQRFKKNKLKQIEAEFEIRITILF